MSNQSHTPTHTPGPLTVELVTKPEEQAYVVKDADGNVTAWLFTHSKNAFGNIVRSKMPAAENADLYASAPDLLAERDRLKANNAELTKQRDLERCEVDRLKALNAELVGALQAQIQSSTELFDYAKAEGYIDDHYEQAFLRELTQARAALAKASNSQGKG